jgi:hypothetical protein
VAKITKKVGWRIDINIANEIKKYALNNGHSQVWVVERALKEFLNKYNKVPPFATTSPPKATINKETTSNSILEKINQIKGE